MIYIHSRFDGEEAERCLQLCKCSGGNRSAEEGGFGAEATPQPGVLDRPRWEVEERRGGDQVPGGQTTVC